MNIKTKNRIILISAICVPIIIIVSVVSIIFGLISGLLRPADIQIVKSSEMRVLDLPDCGISVQFPKTFEGRELIAYRPPEMIIHRQDAGYGGIFSSKNGAVIGNPIFSDGEGKITDIEVDCIPIDKKEYVHPNDERFTKEDFKKEVGWQIADEQVENITRSRISGDIQGLSKLGPQISRTFKFNYKGKQIRVEHLYRTKASDGLGGSLFSGLARKGLYGEQINILKIGDLKPTIQVNTEIEKWTEPGVEIETKDVNFVLPFKNGEKLKYVDTYIWKKKNGKRLNDNRYAISKVYFKDQEVAKAVNSLIDESYEFTKPLYRVGQFNLGDYYNFDLNFPSSFANGYILKSSVDGGKTWQSGIFNGQDIESPSQTFYKTCEDYMKQKGFGYQQYYEMCIGTWSSMLSVKNDREIKDSNIFKDKNPRIQDLQSFQNQNNSIKTELFSPYCFQTSSIQNSKSRPCLKTVVYKPMNGGYVVDIDKTYQEFIDYNKNPANKSEIEAAIEKKNKKMAPEIKEIEEKNRDVEIKKGQVVKGNISMENGVLSLEEGAIVEGNLILKNVTLNIKDKVVVKGNIQLDTGKITAGNEVKVLGSISAKNAFMGVSSNSEFADIMIENGSLSASNKNQFQNITLTPKIGLSTNFSEVSLNSENTVRGNIKTTNKVSMNSKNNITGKIETKTISELEKSNTYTR
jgi:cytoskeletal protein CcmA (bactofilin family)